MRARVVVVDDDPDIRTLLRMWLQKSGYGVVEIEDGEGALSFLERETPDMVLLDLRLPGISGTEVLERIQSGGTAGFPPVIVISAHITDAEIQHLVDAGARAALAKPFNAQVLLDEIERALSS